MKRSFKSRLVSAALTCAMILTSPVAMLKAAAYNDMYVSEVFIAYGSTEEEARQWLKSHDWEPVDGNFNAGKDNNVAAVMGIKCTNDPNNAITDMAVMNMGTEGYTGYSFDDYQSLLNEKKADIDEFVDCFMPVIQEYRENYNGKGSAAGKARAQLAHDLLNRFYDGEVNGKYAVNDTGMALGDLFLATTRRELGEAKYDGLSKNKKVKYGDLQQILLESSGLAVYSIEQALVLAADSDEDSWMDRLSYMSGLSMQELAEFYADGSSSLGDSAAKSLMQSKYGDAAEKMASEYDSIAQDLIWFEAYIDTNGLRNQEGESEEAYIARFEAHLNGLKAKDEEYYKDTIIKLNTAFNLWVALNSITYKGDWGETLADFFHPADGMNYGQDTANFLPMAAALSDGQRAGINFLSLKTLIEFGANEEAAVKDSLPDIQDLTKDDENVDVYSGVNRAIFRNGVALTNAAMMEKARGYNPYEQLWDPTGILEVGCYASFTMGALMLLAGSITYYRSTRYLKEFSLFLAKDDLIAKGGALSLTDWIEEYEFLTQKDPSASVNDLAKHTRNLYDTRGGIKYGEAFQEAEGIQKSMSSYGRWFMAIGGIMMIAAAAVAGAKLYEYFNRDFLPIPVYIVDEADIVSYSRDKNGNEVKNINFDQFQYYEVVKCNRQDIGVNSHAQDGVDQYAEWGCGDAADLNCDVGKQWLALYTIKNPAKGRPILSKSLKLQTGSDEMPNGCTVALHYFTFTYAADLGDMAYAFHNDKNGVYFFWDTTHPYYASTFTKGQLALAGVGGLVVGILGASVVMLATKKRKETPDQPSVA